MKYTEAIEYMESLSSCDSPSGLENVRILCEKIGNPQKDLSFVHITGSNGKESVLAYVSTVLKCARYKVGRYISPMLSEERERIQVNGKPITQKLFCELTQRVKGICESMAEEGWSYPTAGEVNIAMALLCFKEQGCDIVVVESGMGSLFDTTDIIENTKVAVFTGVSMDQMAGLEDAAKKNIAQKAGIIKKGCHAVTVMQEPSVMRIIENKANELGVTLRIADLDKAKKIRYGLEKQRFDYEGWKNLEITLAGMYQIKNAVLAIEVLKCLQEQGYSIGEAALRRGLKETQWKGCFTVLAKHPYFVADGAHNEEATMELVKSLEFYFTNKRIVFIMGVLRDTDYERIIGLTHKYADFIITVTSPGDPRSLSAYELASEVAKLHPNVTAVDSLEEAVEVSALLTEKKDVIVAFGSLSFLGRLMDIVEKRTAVKK